MQSFNREFTLHSRLSDSCDTCMFADSSGKFQVNVWFQVKVWFNLSNRWQKGQAQSIHIHSINLG